MNTGRRIVVAAYLLLVTLACVYVPWRGFLPRDADESGVLLVPTSESRDLGYGWLWRGPLALNAAVAQSANETKMQAALDKARGQDEADRRALVLGRRATAEEVEQATAAATSERQSREQSIRLYWRWNASPNFALIGLTICALTALAGAVFFLASDRRIGRCP